MSKMRMLIEKVIQTNISMNMTSWRNRRKSLFEINFFFVDYTKNNHEHEYVNVEFVDTFRILKYTYQFCQQIFYFNNKLYCHVRTSRKTYLNNVFVIKYINVKQLKNDNNI